MDYPFSHFLRHVQRWPQFRELPDVVTAPEKSTVPVHIGSDMSARSLHMRLRHMLASEGCRAAERDYRAPRYFAMLGFIEKHEAAFRKAGFLLIDDGIAGVFPFAMLRAVHETFRGEPLLYFETEPAQPVIERAVKYNTKEGWHYE